MSKIKERARTAVATARMLIDVIASATGIQVDAAQISNDPGDPYYPHVQWREPRREYPVEIEISYPMPNLFGGEWVIKKTDIGIVNVHFGGLTFEFWKGRWTLSNVPRAKRGDDDERVEEVVGGFSEDFGGDVGILFQLVRAGKPHYTTHEITTILRSYIASRQPV